MEEVKKELAELKELVSKLLEIEKTKSDPDKPARRIGFKTDD